MYISSPRDTWDFDVAREAVEKRVLDSNNGWCKLCERLANEDHFVNPEHMRTVAFNAHVDLWLGLPAVDFRRYEHGCQAGQDGTLTYDKLVAFWGCELQSAANRLKQKIDAVGLIVKDLEKRSWFENRNAVTALVPAFIAFGLGNGFANIMLLDHELPRSRLDDYSEWWPVMVVRFGDLQPMKYIAFEDEIQSDSELVSKDNTDVNSIWSLVRLEIAWPTRHRSWCWVMGPNQWKQDIPEALPCQLRQWKDLIGPVVRTQSMPSFSDDADPYEIPGRVVEHQFIKGLFQ
jgi:hypothetical protein